MDINRIRVSPQTSIHEGSSFKDTCWAVFREKRFGYHPTTCLGSKQNEAFCINRPLHAFASATEFFSVAEFKTQPSEQSTFLQLNLLKGQNMYFKFSLAVAAAFLMLASSAHAQSGARSVAPALGSGARAIAPTISAPSISAPSQVFPSQSVFQSAPAIGSGSRIAAPSVGSSTRSVAPVISQSYSVPTQSYSVPSTTYSAPVQSSYVAPTYSAPMTYSSPVYSSSPSYSVPSRSYYTPSYSNQRVRWFGRRNSCGGF